MIQIIWHIRLTITGHRHKRIRGLPSLCVGLEMRKLKHCLGEKGCPLPWLCPFSLETPLFFHWKYTLRERKCITGLTPLSDFHSSILLNLKQMPYIICERERLGGRGSIACKDISNTSWLDWNMFVRERIFFLTLWARSDPHSTWWSLSVDNLVASNCALHQKLPLISYILWPPLFYYFPLCHKSLNLYSAAELKPKLTFDTKSIG